MSMELINIMRTIKVYIMMSRKIFIKIYWSIIFLTMNCRTDNIFSEIGFSHRLRKVQTITRNLKDL